MIFYQPDPSNAPELSVYQQFEMFTQKWWKMEDFVLQTAENICKIFVIGAYPIEGGGVTFLGGMYRSDRDPQSSKIILEKINITQKILAR